MTSLPEPANDPRYGAFVEAFNAGRYFEAHEILEDFWLHYSGPDRRFYQGLIQVAVAAHHYTRGNILGAERVASSARRNLTPWLPKYARLDAQRLLDWLDRSVAGEGPPPAIILEPDTGLQAER